MMRFLLPMLLCLGCQQYDPANGGDSKGQNPGVTGAGIGEFNPVLVFNEVQCDNESTWQRQQDFTFPDWLEIYNPTTEAVDLSTVWIESNAGTWEGQEGTIGPGELLLLIADDSVEADHLPFGLDNGGEDLTLYVDQVVSDRLYTGELGADITMERYPDGGAWSPSIRATPGIPNKEPSETLDPTDSIYQLDDIVEIRFYITAQNIATMDSWSKIEVPANMEFEGQVFFENIGIRLKGSGTFQNMNAKPSFRVDINQGQAGRYLRGLKNLNLHNSGWDASYMREFMAYKLFRDAGSPASRVAYARVYVNDVDFGLYLNVETPDNKFIKQWYENNDGELYEGQTWNDDPGQGNFNVANIEMDDGPLQPNPFHLWEIDRIVSGANNDAAIAQLQDHLDMERFLAFAAAECISDQWDGYESPHNWRMYIDHDRGKVDWLPAGIDVATYANDNTINDSNGNVFQFCWDNQGCRQAYKQKLLDLAQIMEDENYTTYYQDVFAFIQADIASDPRMSHNVNDVENEYQTIGSNIAQRPDQIRAQAN